MSIDHGDGVDQQVQELIRSLGPTHEEDIQALLAAYGLAIMAAQLMERAGALIVAGGDLDASEQLSSEEVARHFEPAFTKETLGAFKNRAPIANDTALRARVAEAWKMRNDLVHRFFLEHVTSIFSVEARTKLMEDLEQAGSLFSSVGSELSELAMELAVERGVAPDELRRFGNLALLSILRSPERFEGLNPWATDDGERFVLETADSLGIVMEQDT